MFESVAEKNIKAAEALSEPFVREVGAFAVSTAEAIMVLDPERIAVIGVSYIDADPDYKADEAATLEDYYDHEAVQIKDYFFLNPKLDNPYRSYRAFIDNYKGTVHNLHKYGDRLTKVLTRRYGEQGTDEMLDEALDQTMQSGLRTLGAFAVFSVGRFNVRHASGLIIPEATARLAYKYREEYLQVHLEEPDLANEVDEIVAEVKPESTVEQRLAGRQLLINGDPAIRSAGTFTAAQGMPRAEVAEGQLGAHPLVEKFTSMSRAELRKYELDLRKAGRKAGKEQEIE